MPIYSYQCKSCSSIFEEFWGSFKEAEEYEQAFIETAPCPKCKDTGKQKLISAPLVNFKGEGWSQHTIGPQSGRVRDSSGNLKDHAKRIHEETKNLKTEDLFGDIKV